MEMWSGLPPKKIPFAHFLSSHARAMQASQGLYILHWLFLLSGTCFPGTIHKA